MLDTIFSNVDFLVAGVLVPMVLFVVRQYIIPKFTGETSIMSELTLIVQSKNEIVDIPLGVKYIQLVNQTTKDFLFSWLVVTMAITVVFFYSALNGEMSADTSIRDFLAIVVICFVAIMIFLVPLVFLSKISKKIVIRNSDMRSQQMTFSVYFILLLHVSPLWIVVYIVLFYYLIKDKDTINFIDKLQL